MMKKIVLSIFIILLICLAGTAAFRIYKQHHTPPVAYALNVDSSYGVTVAPEKCVSDISGNTPIEATFVSDPDFKKIGTQNISILLTDCYGNTTTVASPLHITPVVDELTLEASETPRHLTPSMFLSDPDSASEIDVTLDDYSKVLDTAKVGNYNITLLCDGIHFTSTLHVTDTTPPQIVTKNRTIWPYDSVSVSDFIAYCRDASTVTYAYETEPDCTTAGEQEITIHCTDASGNTTDANALLTVKKDTMPPVLQGVRDRQITVGETLAYKQGVSATDNSDGEVTISVDNSKVKLNTPGEYEAIYIATDPSGNETKKSITITVVEVSDYTEEVDELCEDILSKILTNDMTQVEQAEAIYNYVHRTITYIGHSDKSDWVQGAYQGFTKKQGDCFTYFAASKALLTHAGIQNMDIKRIGDTHFWNLVYIRNGWYHFDASPNSGHFRCFLKTDAEVAAYGPSVGRPEYYDFDPSLYPATPTESFQK